MTSFLDYVTATLRALFCVARLISVLFQMHEQYTDTDTLLTKKAWAPQGINDIHVQMAQMSNIIDTNVYIGGGVV